MEVRGCPLEVVVEVLVPVVVLPVDRVGFIALLLGRLDSLTLQPLCADLLHLLLVVEFRVVVLVLAQHQPFVQRQDAVVLVFAPFADELPPPLLLLQVQTRGVGEEEEGEHGTGQAEPWNRLEYGSRGEVGVQKRRHEGAELAGGRGQAMGRGTDRRRVHFSCGKEGDRVGSELVEERRQEVHGLERVDGAVGVVMKREGRNGEEDKVGSETDQLHPLAAVCGGLAIGSEARVCVTYRAYCRRGTTQSNSQTD